MTAFEIHEKLKKQANFSEAESTFQALFHTYFFTPFKCLELFIEENYGIFNKCQNSPSHTQTPILTDSVTKLFKPLLSQ